jgi:RNA polymerase sigma factor (sigma-70 family)
MQIAAKQTRIDANSVIREHDLKIKTLASRFVSSGAPIEDLIQEGRFALFRKMDTWRGESSLWTYAKRAVLTSMVEYATREVVERHEEYEEAIVGTQRQEGTELQVLIAECFSVLSPQEKAAVEMKLMGENLEAIGAALSISKSSAENLVNQAIETLKERLQ